MFPFLPSWQQCSEPAQLFATAQGTGLLAVPSETRSNLAVHTSFRRLPPMPLAPHALAPRLNFNFSVGAQRICDGSPETGRAAVGIGVPFDIGASRRKFSAFLDVGGSRFPFPTP